MFWQFPSTWFFKWRCLLLQCYRAVSLTWFIYLGILRNRWSWLEVTHKSVLRWQCCHLQWPQLPVRTVWWNYSSVWSTGRGGLHIPGSSQLPCKSNSPFFMCRLEYQPFFNSKVLILAISSGQCLLKLNLLRRGFSSHSFKSVFSLQGYQTAFLHGSEVWYMISMSNKPNFAGKC